MPDGANPRRLRGGGPVPPPPRPRGSRRWPAEAVADRATRPGRGRRPLVAGPGRDPGPGSGRPASSSSTNSSAPSTATTAPTSRSASSCGPATAGPRSARSGGSRPRPGPRRKATGASSAGSTSATPTGRRRSTPSSWSSATAARRPSSGAVRWTNSPGTTSTTRRTAGWAAWRRSTGSTTSRPASPTAAAPGDRSTSSTASMPGRWAFTSMPARSGPRTEGEDGATRRRLQGPGHPGPALRRPGRAPGVDRRRSGGPRDQADLPGDRPVGGGELGGREAVLATAAGVVARAVRPGQDGAGAQGLHGPFRGSQLCGPVHSIPAARWRSAAARDRVQILDPQTGRRADLVPPAHRRSGS